jgi:hypothetical protein
VLVIREVEQELPGVAALFQAGIDPGPEFGAGDGDDIAELGI